VLASKRNKYLEKLKILIKNIGLENKVLFPGFIADEDLVPLYYAAEIFAFPSLYEGFGIPPIEAMACGTPVVAANTTSLPEVLENAAVLVDPLDTQKLSQEISNVLTDSNLSKKLIQRGLERSKKFSTIKCAKDLLKCLIT
jgi:glycosyltransferase involved in cell wall biosynthesis